MTVPTDSTNLHPLAVLGPAEHPSGGLAGYCRTTYAALLALLGPPHQRDIDGKVSVEWAFRCSNGTTFHIYDWKQPRTPKGQYWWHIGGNSAQALAAFSRHTGLPASRNPLQS